MDEDEVIKGLLGRDSARWVLKAVQYIGALKGRMAGYDKALEVMAAELGRIKGPKTPAHVHLAEALEIIEHASRIVPAHYRWQGKAKEFLDKVRAEEADSK